ncbi:hypothetical protein EBZ39_05040 [bacterium]|nr:hypothetical protein [bacterium]
MYAVGTRSPRGQPYARTTRLDLIGQQSLQWLQNDKVGRASDLQTEYEKLQSRCRGTRWWKCGNRVVFSGL